MNGMTPVQWGFVGAGGSVAAGVVAMLQGGGLVPLLACLVFAPLVGFGLYRRMSAQAR